MSLHELLIAPFAEFDFMRRALVGCVVLALSCAPVGVLLVLRRMSLMGDALSHAVLPGAAVGYLIGGFALPWLAGGGIVAALLVAVLAGVAGRYTVLNEDASFAGFYLMALALGVVLISRWGSQVDLIHLLFGSVLAIDDAALYVVAAVATVSIAWLALCYRGVVLECVDPNFLAAAGRGGSPYHLGLIVLTVLNLVAGFQAMGTLMAIGLMMLPATVARLWADTLPGLMGVAWLVGLVSTVGGLLVSYHAGLPSGPAIVLVASLFYLLSLTLAPHGWRGQRGPQSDAR
ncbi:metal ABC transporter permease [Jeongeupia chitinilytica]|uniref:Zinc ABC transporter permease n=1 Tax=Jeongeupia chitinilytica TaxID=1041641 RepID=A0ABQ3GXD4_9NEIS|nr:metal ABC transporter permease [Jeongeupia chitinilytica]GHD57005.1 zinc ABC transporter permease [Jeongeupia chitinilytica]